MSQLIASASETLQIWEFVNQEECKSLSKCSFAGIPTSISWNHTNQVVAVGLSDKKIDLVQATTGQLLSTLPFSAQEGILEHVKSVKFSGNSRYLASAEGKAVQLWDLKKRSLKTKLVGHKNSVVAISFFADGTIAAGDSGGAIKMWDVKSDSSYQEMNVDQVTADRNEAGPNFALTCMELSLSGPSRVAAGYSDGSLCLWDPVTLIQLRKQHVHRLEVSAIAFSPKNPRLIATSSFDGRMTLVDTGSKSADASASIDIGGKLTSITFHEDAIHCAVGTDNGRVMFYDWRNVRKPIVTIECQTSYPVQALSFQVPKIKADSAASTPAKKASITTSPSASSRLNPVFSPGPTPTKNLNYEMLNAVRGGQTEPEAASSSVGNASILQSPSRSTKDNVAMNMEPAGSRRGSAIMSSATDARSGKEPVSGKDSVSSSSGDTDNAAPTGAEVRARPPMKVPADSKERSTAPAPVRNPVPASAPVPLAALTSAYAPFAAPVPTPAPTHVPIPVPIQAPIPTHTSVPAPTPIPVVVPASNLLSQAALPANTSSKQNPSQRTSMGIYNQAQTTSMQSTSLNQGQSSGISQGQNTSASSHNQNQSQSQSQPSNPNVRSNSYIQSSEKHFTTTHSDEESMRRTTNPLNKPVTCSELQEALQLVKYDFHKELQGLMREQVRQFSIAQEDTSKLFKDLNAQLQELLESNAALRAENDQLRRIY